MYLMIVKYSSLAERKRVEYTLERWRGRINIFKPEGMIVMIDGEELGEMLGDLYSRVPKSNVEIYSLNKTSLNVEKEKKIIRMDVDGSLEAVEKFISFIMAKRRATLKSSLGKMEKVYETYTKFGRAHISVRLKKSGEKVNIFIAVEGFGKAVAFMHEKIMEDLIYFKQGR